MNQLRCTCGHDQFTLYVIQAEPNKPIEAPWGFLGSLVLRCLICRHQTTIQASPSIGYISLTGNLLHVRPEPSHKKPAVVVTTVHILKYGSPKCNFVHNLLPSQWPPGHAWVGEGEREKANCRLCLAL